MSWLRPSRADLAIGGVALALLALLVAATAFGPYGWFIDELYYLACARHLAWGYVDHPPLSVAVLAGARWLLGGSMVAARLPAALAASGAVVATGLLARRLGGGAGAQALAAASMALAPVTQLMGSFHSMNAFELLLWPLIALVLLRLVRTDEPRLWLLVGGLLGLGLENKHTTVLLGAAIGLAVVATPLRRHLKTPWPWLGVLVALVLLAPNLLWQASHDWASLTFYRRAQADKNIPTPVWQALAMQALMAGPGAAPLLLWGAGSLLFSKEARPWRSLGWVFAALFVSMVLSGSSRPDRIGGAYPLAFAGGAVALERLAARWGGRWLKGGAWALTVASAVALAPLVLPLFPPPEVAAYVAHTGLLPRVERGSTSPIPQWLADRTGWEDFTADIAAVYRALPPEDQARAAVYAPAYGPAGALELLGPAHGLTAKVYSNHNSYWLWGRGLPNPEVLIAIGSDEEDLAQLFTHVERRPSPRCTYCMSWRDGLPVYVARGPKLSLAEFWEHDPNFE